ncbi:RidA family protein [Mucilaginibacter hurinus]|uniref:RidA family protein n=1 Tax=Mucilaginibacter hurinus TaxID=2201324 RepID=A0A367GSP4_9SPHI|nr:RidA family protein [Mucilaginibacter hurinus]RCH56270.1 RidA family protein [Mucilaginibacter hurinus]
MHPLNKLAELNIDLTDRPQPGGNYVSLNIRGNIGYVAIQFPINGGNRLYTGRFGSTLSTAEGYQAGKLCAVNVLRQIHHYVGLDNIEGINHADIYYQAAGDWDEGPKVADGVSDIFTEILGDAGVHSRGIYGVERLSRNFSIGVTASFTLKNSCT